MYFFTRNSIVSREFRFPSGIFNLFRAERTCCRLENKLKLEKRWSDADEEYNINLIRAVNKLRHNIALDIERHRLELSFFKTTPEGKRNGKK